VNYLRFIVPIALTIATTIMAGSAYADSEFRVDELTAKDSERALPHRRYIDVSRYLTNERLKFNLETNPGGIFVSGDADLSTYSDSPARRELISLNAHEVESVISYYELGDPNADPIVLFHGIPASAYEWRMIMPTLAKMGRVIAFDQIGQGRSSKHKSLTYTWKQQLAYTEAFFKALGLDKKRITIVATDTGGSLGFAFAARHPQQIKGLAFFETVLGPVPSFSVMPIQAQQFRSPEGYRRIIDENAFTENLIIHSAEIVPPNDRPFTINPFTPDAIRAYQRPYKKKDNRRVLAQWVREIPIMDGSPDGFGNTNIALWSQFAGYLMTSTVPKLFIYASPGVLNTDPTVQFVLTNYNRNNSLTAINLGLGFHFLHEDNPDQVGYEIADWYQRLR